jgi:maltose phosphorylase
MRVLDGKMKLQPLIPDKWKSYSFHARFRDNLFEVKVTRKEVVINNLSRNPIQPVIFGKEYEIKTSEKITVKMKK